jgi:hypothetical protein
MKSFLIVEEGEKWLIKNLEKELIDLKKVADALFENSLNTQKIIKGLELKNSQLEYKNRKLAESLKTK